MKWLSACANINSSSWVYHGKLLSSQCAKHRHIIQLYIYLFQKDCKMPLLRILHLQRVQHFKAKLVLRLKVKKLLHTIKDICNLGKAGRQWLKTVLKQIMTVASCQIIFFWMIFRSIRAGPGSGHRQPGGWLLSCHSDTAAGVAGLPSPGDLAAPLGSSTTSLLWLSAPRRWLDPTVTKEEPLPITLITSSPK